MKIILAALFRVLFRIPFIKKLYFETYRRIFKPFNLFKGVILKTSINDHLLILRIDDWIQSNLYFLGKYERAELKAIERFLTNDGIFIDIGANIGLYTLHVSKLMNKKGQIISFEPFSENFNALIQNITLNGLSNVCVEKLAIGEKEGIINLYYDKKENNLGMVTSKPIESAVIEEVKLVSLDAYLINKSVSKIDLIKIDIEGFELAALLGMKRTLATFHPTLLIEILDTNETCGQSSKCETFLKDFGYRKYFIDDNGNLSENQVNVKRMNYIFTTKTFANKIVA